MTPTTDTDTPFARWSPLDIRGAAEDLHQAVVRHRRELHRHPELAWDEHRTASYIEHALAELGIASRRVVGTGVVAVIEGRGERVVGVRADMDALPIHEAEGREGYRSVNEGIAHACGHDGHVAVVLGLAELLSAARDLPGSIAFYFQPAEEADGGAAPMVKAGALRDPVPDAVLALHAAPQHPVGTIGIRPGPVVASFDVVTLVVKGVGGHAAHPEDTVDPVPIAAQIILATQQMITREVNVMEPAIITFGEISGGNRPNVIPSEVTLKASVRALHPHTRQQVLSRLVEMSRSIAAAHRAGLSAEVVAGYPAGSNDDGLAATVREAATAVLGAEHVIEEPYPSLGSEDFFALGDEGAAVCMFRLGVGNPDRGIEAPLHSASFDLDEDALPLGVAVMAESVRRLLTA